MPDLKLAAGINFGKPATEFIIEATEAGEATSCRNAVTGVEYIGGGGSSDFSTAEVIIDGALTANSGRLYVPVLIHEEGEDDYLDSEIFETGEYDILLFKNAILAYYVADAYGTASTTGSIQYYEDEHAFVITGNGTITFDEYH